MPHPLLQSVDRGHHPGRVQKGGEGEKKSQGRQVRPLAETPYTGSTGILPELFSGGPGQDSHVVMRTSLDAFHAEGAVHVSHLRLLVEPKLASVLKELSAFVGPEGRGPLVQAPKLFVSAHDAIPGAAGGAHVGLPNGDLQGRGQGVHEMELADGADVFAEGRSPEEAVDDEGGYEITEGQPCGEEGAGPEVIGFVSPEKEEEEEEGKPLGSEGSGPVFPSREELLGQPAGKHEGAGHTEEVSGHQEGQRHKSSPVNPGEDAGHVLGREPGPPKPVHHHQNSHAQEKDLEYASGVAPTEERA